MAKKKAVKKKTANKTVGRKRSAKTQRKAAEARLLPEKLLDGQSVFVAGKFPWDSGNKNLRRFLRNEGAKLATKVSATTDMLIVGEGATAAAKKQAAKLNQAGAAIQVIHRIDDLLQITADQTVEILRSYGDLQRLAQIIDFGFLDIGGGRISGESFENVVLKRDDGKALELDGMDFVGCAFVNVHLSGVEFGIRLDDCTFQDCRFDGVSLSSGIGRNLTLTDITGTSMDLDRVDDGRWLNVCVDHLESVNLERVDLQDCRFLRTGMTEDGGYGYLELVSSTVGKCNFGVLALDSLSAKDVELSDVQFAGGKANECEFQKCRLNNVTFDGVEFDTMVFDGCHLNGVEFRNCKGTMIAFGDSQLIDVVAGKTDLVLLSGSDEQINQTRGFTPKRRIGDGTKHPLIDRLAGVCCKSAKLSFTLDARSTEGNSLSVSVSAEGRVLWLAYEIGRRKDSRRTIQVGDWSAKLTRAQAADGLLRLIAESLMDDVDPQTLKVKTSKCLLKSAELKKLIIGALYEAMGKEPQSDEEIAKAKKESRSQAAALRKEMLAQLQAGNVKAFNKHTQAARRDVGHVRKAKLAGVDLQKINLSGMDLAESDLSGADLTGANLQNAVLRKANLSKANLDKTKLKSTNLRGANLAGATFSGASFQKEVTLNDADVTGTVFDGVKFGRGTNLCGLDLSGIVLTNTKLDGCIYNEKTRLPKSVSTADMKKMRWYGEGIPPHERKQNKKVSGPIDFDQFMARLNEITDSSRLKKALKMLKADSFQLFSEVGDTSVRGVVKSQSDANLVYSCSLDSEGRFTCCTQNLNSCGGLRGALCKHLLVLIVGLTQSGELNATEVDDWINSSKLNKPELDRDQMSEVLLKYKGAEAGEIDWRPTETVPEDFFTF